MIKEIEEFTLSLKEEIFQPTAIKGDALYVVIDLDEEGNPIADSYRSELIDKKNKAEDFVRENELILREFHSDIIEMNKCLDMGGKNFKKLHSSNPYTLWFKKESFQFVKERLENFYKGCKEINDEIQVIIEDSEKIKNFAKNDLLEFIRKDDKYKNLKSEKYVRIFFGAASEKYKAAHDSYLAKKTMSKKKGDSAFDQNNFFGSAPVKKPFIVPQTTRVDTFFKVTQETAEILNKFTVLLESKPRKMPNPLPVFIDGEELNNKIIKLYTIDGAVSFREIIRALYEQHSNDIKNYYLIYWGKGLDGLTLYDTDYVDQFEFKANNTVYDLFNLNNNIPVRIDNIFDFEIKVFQPLFDYQLFSDKGTTGGALFYFEKIKPRINNEVNFQNLLKYRKAVFDYVYKSQRSAFTAPMLYDIVMSSVLYSLHISKSLTDDWSIKYKLNLLFSLYNSLINYKEGAIPMPSQIEEYKQKTLKLLDDDSFHLQDDDHQFAFTAGQMIYYLLTKSKSENRTHAMLEPFISKTDPAQFKAALTRGIEQYKHALNFGDRRFEKAASEVLSYTPIKNLKELLPSLLAGYFAKSLFFEKRISN